MSTASDPDLSLFLDILKTLEAYNINYVIIGGFAATIYGITRTTYDIDIVVDLDEAAILALAESYPLPRYYADPHQMRIAMAKGSMFNIIDTDQGEKADLFPITMDSRYQPALDNRIRKLFKLSGKDPLEAWTARPEDVIVGKLMAWAELKTIRHSSDIYEMLVAEYLGLNPLLEPPFDESYIGQKAQELGDDILLLWQDIKEDALQEVRRIQGNRDA